jgi:hypothetical protein
LPLHDYKDEVVEATIENYMEKSVADMTADDYEHISRQLAFSFDVYNKGVQSLQDVPELFPELRYLKLGYAWSDEARLSESDCELIEQMETLRAVDMLVDGLPTLEFAQRLPYVSLRYMEEAYLPDGGNLSEASVLGGEFINIEGNIKEYVKVADGEQTYELFVTDRQRTKAEGEYDATYAAKVFVSEKKDADWQLAKSIDVPGRIDNASGGLILADVNFDGSKDVLVALGKFGTQAMVAFLLFKR